MTERELHKLTHRYFKRVLAEDVIFHHSANEKGAGRMRGREGGQWKGFPDWFLSWRDPYDNGRTGFIELKREGAYCTPEQKYTLHKLKEQGSYTAVCRSIDDVEGTLKAWGVPMTGRVSA